MPLGQTVRSLPSSVEQLLLMSLPPPDVAARLPGPPRRYLTLWPVAYGDSLDKNGAGLALLEEWCPVLDRALVHEVNTPVTFDQLFAIEAALYRINTATTWRSCGRMPTGVVLGGRRRNSGGASSPYPSLTTFDAGSGEFCVIRRVRTDAPLQALVLLNDPAYVEAAGGLAKLMLAQWDQAPEGPPDLWLPARTGPVALGEAGVVPACCGSMRARSPTSAGKPDAWRAAGSQPIARWIPGQPGPEQAALTVVADVILETLTRR